MDNKKNKIISSISILLLIIMMVGATYAFFTGTDASDTDTPLQVTTNTVDSLIFNVDTDITLVADMSNFTVGKGNREGVANATATLKANNKTNNATGNYYLYFDIKENELAYTTEAKTAELLLQVTGPDGALGAGDIAELNYVTVTDGKGEQVSGFDVTEVQNLITIAINKEITTTSEKVDNWEIKIILVNLNDDQTENGGKRFNGEILIQNKAVEGMLKSVNLNYSDEIWGYRDQIKEIIFTENINISKEPTYTFDISSVESDPVMAYMYDNEDGTFTTHILIRGKLKANKESEYLFYNFNNLQTIKGIEKLDTTDVTSLAGVFSGCNNLQQLDLSSWNTSNVTSMSNLFYECTNLQVLKLNTWDTSQVTNMSSMFYKCENLENLNISNFKTSKVTNLATMFHSCKKLKGLNLNGWDISNVTNMNSMFQYCEKLTSLNVSSWNPLKVKDMMFMFAWCSSIENLNLSGWNTPKVESINNMFQACSSLKSVDFRSADFTNVTLYSDMFHATPATINVIVNSNSRAFMQARINEKTYEKGGTVTIA